MSEEYGLQLELDLKYDKYEAELAKVDADTQKVLRQLRAELKGDSLKFDIEITGAKAAGDTVRAYQLELQKLTHTYKTQEAVVNGLKARLVELNKDEEKNAALIKQVNGLLDKETLKLNRIKISLNNFDAGFADKVIAGLSKISPALGGAIQSIKSFRTELASLQSLSIGAGALAGLGLGATVIGGTVTAIKAAHEAMDGLSTASAEATEPIFLLAERFELTYEEAEKLHGIMAIDGTNAEVFAKSVQRLNKELASGNAGNATKMLERYNVSLRNADGTQKSYIEQTKALADAYKKAKEAGEGLDFLTNTLGSGGSQFAHLLNGFDDYLAKWEKANDVLKINYDLNHSLLDEKKVLAESERQYAALQGQIYTPAVIAGLKEQEKLLKSRKQAIIENSDAMQQYTQQLAVVETAFARLTQGMGALWDSVKQTAVGGLVWLAKAADSTGTLEADAAANLVQAQAQKPMQPPAPKVDTKEYEKAAKKITDAYAKIARELSDIGASDYEKQLNRLRDEVDANIKAGVDELTAWDLYYAKKDELDKKQSEETQKRMDAELQKYQQELQKRKQAEESISQVYMTEVERRIAAIKKQRDEWIKAGADEVAATKAAQKQIQEARMSEAERAVRDNLQLARFIAREQEKGNENWRVDAQQYAQRQYLQGLGATPVDIQNIAKIGPDLLRGITQSAKETALAPITANITVNFDNAIMEDVSTQNKMADMVAQKILDILQNVMGAQYSYGGQS